MVPGADRVRVVSLIPGISDVLAGLIVGIPLAIGSGMLIASQLYGGEE